MSEVRNQDWANIFEVATEDGENADFIQVLGTTGGADKLLIIFDSDKFDLVNSEELHNINVSGTVRAPLVARLKVKSTNTGYCCW